MAQRFLQTGPKQAPYRYECRLYDDGSTHYLVTGHGNPSPLYLYAIEKDGRIHASTFSEATWIDDTLCYAKEMRARFLEYLHSNPDDK
jgi:hypothetical protein